MRKGEGLKVDVIVRTFNSSRTLARCLESISKMVPVNRTVVVDHKSSDGSADIAVSYGAVVLTEDVGLGHATMLGISETDAEFVLFVDSDVEIVSHSFVAEALKILEDRDAGAVVGQSVGHPFAYGLPLGLTMFRRSDLLMLRMPPEIGSAETYHIRRHLKNKGLKVKYLMNSMVHRSPFRSYRYWPEWQGSQVRESAGFSPREIVYSALVIFLLLANSKSARNLFYYPIFLMKFLIGFTSPLKWGKLDRDSSLPGMGNVPALIEDGGEKAD